MSSDAIFAEPMLDTEEYLAAYLGQLSDLGKKGLLPPLDQELEFKVYSIRGSKFGAHKSIVLTTNDEHFVTIELGFHEVNGKKYIYPATESLDKSFKRNMEFHGKIKTKGKVLVGKALAVMKHFGSYFKLTNNCQDYCNMYLEAIGLKHAQKLTDADEGLLKGALFTGLVALIVYAVYKSNKE